MTGGGQTCWKWMSAKPRDGSVVVIHDATVDRTTNGIGSVEELTLDEISRLDAGYHFKDLTGEHSFRGEG
ncbi:MAG: hypothetical protein CM1200mP14_13410 [Gammaproteobacteria bacterium]|nr:MAG: hypothetical protein CM1200mP14_13410 [Gammaproteobacteria bacterium]